MRATSDAPAQSSFAQFLGLILVGQAAWFALIVLGTVAIEAATGGAQGAYDYMLGLVQTWFIIALFGLISSVLNVSVSCVSWALRDARSSVRVIVVGLLGALASLYMSATLPHSDGASGVEVSVLIGGLLAGLLFGVFAAVLAGRFPRRSA